MDNHNSCSLDNTLDYTTKAFATLRSAMAQNDSNWPTIEANLFKSIIDCNFSQEPQLIEIYISNLHKLLNDPAISNKHKLTFMRLWDKDILEHPEAHHWEKLNRKALIHIINQPFNIDEELIDEYNDQLNLTRESRHQLVLRQLAINGLLAILQSPQTRPQLQERTRSDLNSLLASPSLYTPLKDHIRQGLSTT